jgi:MFS family permease
MFKRDAEVGGEVGSLAELALCSEGVQTGAVVVPFVLGDGVAAIASAHLARRLGRAVLAAGCLLLLAGLGSVAIVLRASSPGPDGRWLVLPLCVAGIGTGMSIALNQDVTLGRVQPAEAGAASALLGASQRIGNALGIGVVGSVLFGTHRTSSSPLALARGLIFSGQLALLTSMGLVLVAMVLALCAPGFDGRGSRPSR